jgi:hypothetical protein
VAVFSYGTSENLILINLYKRSKKIKIYLQWYISENLDFQGKYIILWDSQS